jgi:hypothetical protein
MSAGRRRIAFLEQAAIVLRGIATGPTVQIGVDAIFQEAGPYPWIGLLPAPGSKVERDEFGPGSITDSFQVFVFGYVQGATQTDRTELLLNIVEDCQDALHQALTGPFAVWRPGTQYPYADFIDFEEEDLTYHREGTGAEFVLPVMVRIPDTLAA